MQSRALPALAAWPKLLASDRPRHPQHPLYTTIPSTVAQHTPPWRRGHAHVHMHRSPSNITQNHKVNFVPLCMHKNIIKAPAHISQPHIFFPSFRCCASQHTKPKVYRGSPIRAPPSHLPYSLSDICLSFVDWTTMRSSRRSALTCIELSSSLCLSASCPMATALSFKRRMPLYG